MKHLITGDNKSPNKIPRSFHSQINQSLYHFTWVWKRFLSSLTTHTINQSCYNSFPQLNSTHSIFTSPDVRQTDRPTGHLENSFRYEISSEEQSCYSVVPTPPPSPFYVVSCVLIHNFCLVVEDNKNIDYVTVFSVRSSDSFNYLSGDAVYLLWYVDKGASLYMLAILYLLGRAVFNLNGQLEV